MFSGVKIIDFIEFRVYYSFLWGQNYQNLNSTGSKLSKLRFSEVTFIKFIGQITNFLWDQN